MFSEIQQAFISLLEPIEFIANPEKRIFWLYLLSSALLAAGVSYLNRQDILKQLKTIFSLKLWLHPSSRQDFQWLFFNHILRVLLVVPVLGGSLSLAIFINRWLITSFGEGNFFTLSSLVISSLFTLTLFIIEDFTRFILHYFYHKKTWLWRFHAIHHSAEILTPITLYRIHWIEMLINSLRSLIIIGSVSGLFMYLFDNKLNTVDLLGATFFVFLFNLAGANLRHSSVWLRFGKFERWFISPAQHQIHHSTKVHHKDKNFGVTLAIWDRWFGTLIYSQSEKVEQYGLSNNTLDSNQSFIKHFWGRS